MKDIDFLKDIYDDFFGIEKAKEKKTKFELNEKEMPRIELPWEKEETESEKQSEKNIETEKMPQMTKDERMARYFKEIDKLYITEESKNILKKIIEYQRKYNEKIEKQYIPFNMCIYTDNKETMYKIVDIMNASAMFFEYIKDKEPIEVSLYDVEKADKIEQIYDKKYGVILLKDFEAFNSQEQAFKDKFLHKLEEKIQEKPSEFLTIICTKNKETVKTIFEKNSVLKEIFSIGITGTKPDVQEAYQEILNKLKENGPVAEEFEVKLLDYIATTEPNTPLPYPEYRDKLCSKILFNKDIPEYDKEKSIDEIFAELNSLVGLEKVKQMLQDLVSLIELKNKTKDYLKIKDTNMHMVFLGNPGTGKTTVARLISQILYNLKYIKQNKLIEVSSKDLVAEYVGQTAPKTMAVIEKALGGVLFVDEAYSLASTSGGQNNAYNEEAIATLIQAMENYRDNLVVIFAGYTKEMQAFLNANSGIVSRIGYTVEFEDYTEDQLIEIFKSMLGKAGFEITEEAITEARNIIKEYKNSKNFGNARFVRNLYEKTVIKHASNTKNKKAQKRLKTIEKEDISVENLLK